MGEHVAIAAFQNACTQRADRKPRSHAHHTAFSNAYPHLNYFNFMMTLYILIKNKVIMLVLRITFFIYFILYNKQLTIHDNGRGNFLPGTYFNKLKRSVWRRK